MLTREIRGVDGSNRNKYNNVGESHQPARINEMQEESQNALEGTNSWAKHIYSLFELVKKHQSYRVTLSIYNPDSAVYGLYKYIRNSDIRFLPVYLMIVEQLDKNESYVYTGELAWTGKKPTNYLKDMDFARFIEMVNGFENENDTLEFGLSYINRVIELKEDKITRNENVIFERDNLVVDSVNYRTLQDFATSNEDILTMLDVYFKELVIQFENS